MSLTILAVGKKHEEWVAHGIERYQKRLKAPYDTKWLLLPHSPFDDVTAREDESRAILSRLADDDYVILLDEKGNLYDSTELSDKLETIFSSGKKIVLVIGGAYGVSQQLIDRAQFVWSLSPLVFPHQLVRLILVEQIYRAQEISRGGKYHHI